MDYTKPFCIIERKKNDFVVYPTKFVYFTDDKNEVRPLSQSTGPVDKLSARNEDGKIRPIFRILVCGGKSGFYKIIN